MSKESATRIRGFLLAAGAFAVLLVGSQLLPGAGGESKGTPLGILFQGLVYGLLSGLVAAGIILIYRTSRIINFAQAAIGAIGGVFTYNLTIAPTTGLPYFASFLIGVIVSGLVGMALELGFIRRFFESPRLVLTVFTIAVVPALGLSAGFVRNLPIFGDLRDRSFLETIGAEPLPLPFDGFKFRIGDLSIPFGFPHLFALGMSILALLGIAYFLKFTKSGVAVRASANNAERAALLGINVRGLSTLVWTLTGLLSGVGVILTATVSNSFQSVGGTNPAALLAPLGAAVVAKMKSLPIAVATAVGLEIARQATFWSFEEQVFLFDTFLFLVILCGLLLQRQELRRSDEREGSSWKASEEIRPTPKEMLEIGGLRVWRIIVIALGLASVLLFPWVSTPRATNIAGYIAIIGITMLSLVVLTGWAGQVSLGQFALVGVGALVGGALTAKAGISFWLALPLGAAATGIFALLIGVPALRIRGLFLGATTFAFAIAVETNLFNEKYMGWILPDGVDRPKLLFFDFEDERSMYYLTLTAFILAIVVVSTLRRSRPGRILIALRENEPNIQSFGVNLMRTRLMAFVLSGALCGFAGVLLAHHQRAVARANFPAQESIFIFIDAVIGGIGSVSGAILGAVYFGLFRLFGGNPLLQLIIGPIGVLLVLYVAPKGLASVVFGLRDGVLRIIAQRRRMVVPALFADLDPEAIRQQVAPLAEPIPGSGLAALPATSRYRTDSQLYGIRGKKRQVRRRAADEAGAFVAAADRFGEGDGGGTPATTLEAPEPPGAGKSEGDGS